MRRTLAAALSAAALLSSALVHGGSASAAEETSPEIAWVNNNVIVTGRNGNKATVLAKYRCVGEGLHLWASAKQGPNITEENNTSDFADSWYETPEGPAPICDGKTHVLRAEITRVDGFDRLHTGEVWVQFVFFYVDAQGNFARAADVGWAMARAPRGRG